MEILVYPLERNSDGLPYADMSLEIRLETESVVAIGKIAYYGDNVVRFLVRTRDQKEYVVNASKQQAAVKRWLYKTARCLIVLRPRAPSWSIGWVDVPRTDKEFG